jgi:peptide/nickel transport system permease protein
MTQDLMREPLPSGPLDDALIRPALGSAVPGVRGRRRLPWLPLVIVSLIVLGAIFASVVSPYDPLDASLVDSLEPPGPHHLLGTDSLGRDSLSRLLFGARISLTVVVAAVVGASLVGLIVGISSGFVGGIVDTLLMRCVDAFMGLPALLIALVFVVAIGAGLGTVIVALTIVGWAPLARIIRSEVLVIKEREFVGLARIAGASELRIMAAHVLPNVLNTFVVIATLQMSHFVLAEAGLSFLGAGVPPPTPTWGNMISGGLEYLTTAWWLSVIPGVALVALVFSISVLGDWLRDALDPKLRQA